MSMETAGCYAHIVSDLRKRNLLKGASKADLWLAACALEHKAKVATQNVKHFEMVSGLDLVSF